MVFGSAIAFPAVGVAAEAPAAVRALQAGRDGEAALEERNYEAAIERFEQAVDLRPDFPQFLLELAQAQTGAGRLDEAVATLQRYAKLGLHAPVEKADEFALLRPRKDFQEVTKALAANLRPQGKGEIAFTLREVTGLIEGIAWREKTDGFYFGDVHHRVVWMRAKDGTLQRFTPEGDELLGVFGLAVDEANGILWAATSAVPAMRDFSPELAGHAALAEIDLETGSVRRMLPIPRATGDEAPHQLTDLALAPDGGVLLIDGGVPAVWRLAPGGKALERFAESNEFFALQGIAVLPQGIALLADQVNGIIRLELTEPAVMPLAPPADSTLVETKGMVVAPDGRVLAVQTDLQPSRILSFGLDASAETITEVSVLESGHIAMGAPSLACIGTDGDLFVIGNAGWSRFTEPDAKPTAPRQVPIFRTRLLKPKQ